MQTLRVRARCAVALASLLFVTACTTSRGEATDFVDQGVQAVDRSTRAQLAIAQANPELDQAMLSGHAGQFEEGAGASAAQFAAMRQRIEEQNRMLQDVVHSLADGALGSVPGLSSLPSLAAAIGGGLRGSDERNERRTEQVDELTRRNEEQSRERSAAALARAAAAEAAASAVEARLEAKLKEAGDALSADTREKLAAFRGDLDSLRAVADDDERFEKELERYLKAAGLSPEQVAEFKRSTEGFTSEEILKLLAALGAGLGGGAAGSRLGTSRSAKELEKIEKDNQALRHAMTRMNLEVTRAMPNANLSEPLL